MYKFQSNHETRDLNTILTISLNSERNVSLHHFRVVIASTGLEWNGRILKIIKYFDLNNIKSVRLAEWQSNSVAQFNHLKNCIWTSLVFCDHDLNMSVETYDT